MPDFSLESEIGGRIAGVDEVGRGPWAGPVVACAVVIDRNTFPAELAAQLDDSKKLTASKRNALYPELISTSAFGIGQADVVEIDAMNILQASMLAMRRAVSCLEFVPDAALVDGNRDPELPCPTRTVVKGDSKSLTISAASIIAKVYRDRLMTELAEDFPGYGWERNAGYGVKEHRAGLDRLGVTPHHRKSFAPIKKIMASL